jgi:hypothetical protein
MPPTPDDVAVNILSNVIRAMGPLWERRLGDADRALVRACCDDAARLGVRALAAPRTRDAQLQLLRERADIHARLCGSLPLGAGRLADAFWDGFRATVNGAVALAFAPL